MNVRILLKKTRYKGTKNKNNGRATSPIILQMRKMRTAEPGEEGNLKCHARRPQSWDLFPRLQHTTGEGLRGRRCETKHWEEMHPESVGILSGGLAREAGTVPLLRGVRRWVGEHEPKTSGHGRSVECHPGGPRTHQDPRSSPWIQPRRPPP